MKTLTALLLIFFSLTTYAQNAEPDNFTQGMKQGLSQLKGVKGHDDLVKTTNYFERIAQAEHKQWTPEYYAAYSNLLAGLTTTDNGQKDQFWDKALLELEKANTLSADNSEIYALKGYIQFMKMSVDPRARLSFMGLSATSLAQARKLNPENPRIDLIAGQNTFYTPETFGGGKAKAKPFLESAVAKFAIFKPVSEIEPNWGIDTAKALLNNCN